MRRRNAVLRDGVSLSCAGTLYDKDTVTVLAFTKRRWSRLMNDNRRAAGVN